MKLYTLILALFVGICSAMEPEPESKKAKISPADFFKRPKNKTIIDIENLVLQGNPHNEQELKENLLLASRLQTLITYGLLNEPLEKEGNSSRSMGYYETPDFFIFQLLEEKSRIYLLRTALENGANPNICKINEIHAFKTPLEIALLSSNADAVRLLLKYNAQTLSRLCFHSLVAREGGHDEQLRITIARTLALFGGDPTGTISTARGDNMDAFANFLGSIPSQTKRRETLTKILTRGHAPLAPKPLKNGGFSASKDLAQKIAEYVYP